MTRDRIAAYYLAKDRNCAEALLLAANDEYDLNLSGDALLLMGGFGGGMSCGKACGALCSGIAVIGKACITERAHATPGLKEHCGRYVGLFMERMGSEVCEEIVKTFKKEDTRCLETVLLAADALDDVMAQIHVARA